MMMTAMERNVVCRMENVPLPFCISHDTVYSESKVLLQRVWLHLHARGSRWDMNKLPKFLIYSLRAASYLNFRFMFQRSQEVAPINSSRPGVITSVITTVTAQGLRSAVWHHVAMRADSHDTHRFWVSCTSLIQFSWTKMSNCSSVCVYFFTLWCVLIDYANDDLMLKNTVKIGNQRFG